MKAVVLDRYGEPASVLAVRDVPLPEPARNQVRVRMLASPINPSDLLMVRGRYGQPAPLPATPGFEGVGVIDAAGPGILKRVRGLRLGRRVAVLGGAAGSWQEQLVLSALHVVPIPSDIPDDQAASFFVNPASALVMITRVLGVRRGDWLLQTAAASALGKMVIRLGKHHGYRTINVVRRQEHADELRHLGADEVIVADLQRAESGERNVDEKLSEMAKLIKSQESVESRVLSLTQGQGVPFALDPVGGTVGQSALRCLGQGGRLLVYGTLSGAPIEVDPRLLIGGQKRIEGFWLSEWARAQHAWTMLKLFREIIGLMRAGILVTPVEASYPLEEIQTAVAEAEKPGRMGKILLRIGSENVGVRSE